MADQNNQDKTVLVGMTGRLDSTVSAYLLKQQGYRVIGLGVMCLDSEQERKLFSKWDLPALNDIKAMSDKLDIPFYGVHGHDIFEAYISERLVASRLAGEIFRPDVYYHQMLVDILYERAEKLNADFIATGHYAKLVFNQTTKRYSLVMANDAKEDQSYLLSKLKQKHMTKMLLPLSELRKTQVEKIKELLNVSPFPPARASKGYDFKLMRDFIAKNSAEIFRKEGLFLNFREGHTIGDHDGVHLYELGQSKVILKGGMPIDPNLRVVMIDAYKGNVFVDQAHEVSFDTVVLHEVHMDEKWNVAKPSEVYAMLSGQSERIKAIMLYKNNKNIVLSLEDPMRGMVPTGEYVVLYDRSGGSARVIGSGRVLKAGLQTPYGIEVIPKSLNEDEQNESDKESDQKKKNQNEEGYSL